MSIKSTLLVAFATTGIAAMAQTPQIVQWQEADAAMKVYRDEMCAPPQNAVPVSPMSRADLPEAITEPKGEVVDYTYNTAGYYMNWGYLMLGARTGMTNWVWDGDIVYIKDIVSSFAFGTYVKGELDADGNVTVNFPQTLYAYEWNGQNYIYEANLMRFTYENVETDEGTTVAQKSEIVENNSVTYAYDEETDSYTLLLNEGWTVPEGTYTSENMPEYAICYTYQAEVENEEGEMEVQSLFGGYGDASQSFSRFAESITQVPDGLESKQCVLDSYYDARLVDVWVDDANQKIYVTNLYDYLPNSAIVGDIEGDKVVFKSPQYLGFDYGYLIYFVAGIVEDPESEKAEMLEEFTLYYDAEKLILEADDPTLWTATSADPTRLYYFELFPDMVIKYQTEEELCASPLDPIFYSFTEYDMTYGKCTITWYILPYNENGAYLDPQRLYYNMYVDGELYEFTNEEYIYIWEPMVDIPYTYNDAWDISAYYEYHTVAFYFDPAESIGIRSLYEAEDGTMYASNIVVYNIEDGEVSSVQTVEAASDVMQVYYTNLMGQRVAQPTTGIYIRSMVMSDGSIKSSKVYVRR